MKNKLTVAGLTVLIIAALSFSAFTFQQDKGNKGQQNKKDKAVGNQKDKGNQARDVMVIEDVNGNQGKGNQNNKGKGNNGNNGNAGKNNGNGNGNNANGNNSNNGNNNNNGNGNGNNGNKNRDIRIAGDAGNGWEDHVWNRDNFKERKKLRKQDKVTVCHKFNNANEAAVTINVSTNAVNAHMKHGDVVGACPVVNDNRFSDGFWRRRTDYYNSLEDTRDQVSYSQSILGYALSRLTQSRSQLAVMQNNNVPAADIQRKQVVVNELEQNVSVLETLVGAAAGLIASRL